MKITITGEKKSWCNKVYYEFRLYENGAPYTACPNICPYLDGLKHISLRLYIFLGFLARKKEINVSLLEEHLLIDLRAEKYIKVLSNIER